MIAVIDYKCGNLCSVGNALQRIGCEFRITGDEAQIRAASHVILPGVGEASSTMEALQNSGLDKTLLSLTQPVLGICIGMQLMCRFSEEGHVQCLGLFDAAVRKLRVPDELKVPHMGWNTITRFHSPLTDGIAEGSYLYYVHSYAPETGRQTVAVTEYGTPFSAILQNGNFFGTQFHPEKSGAVGEVLLTNFLRL
ncbi:MAG: imidazole glycerol phosphate synthase subunit HisH [Dysgonamonadaceae bacterium]|jgi:glutamine amidotransferase|nr:imidazole glycerol phosphate synthase subunit HisH [Dysgonamonadaceae bacterium]